MSTDSHFESDADLRRYEAPLEMADLMVHSEDAFAACESVTNHGLVLALSVALRYLVCDCGVRGRGRPRHISTYTTLKTYKPKSSRRRLV